MSVHTTSWEHHLLALAREAQQSPVLRGNHPIDQHQLRQAYAQCATITHQHSKTFYMAARLLPPAKRQAAHALYAFCRVTDDLVDEAPDKSRLPRDIARWRERARNPHPTTAEPVLLAWAHTQTEFGIPQGYAEQLIDGIARDININRYQQFDELATYCYGVASTVGLMVMYLVGFKDEQALAYAVKLGIALQLTNILRDIQEDWVDGRLYLPLDELAAFKLSTADITAGVVDARWRAFMRFQIDRARQLYTEAQPGIRYLTQDGRFAITAAARLYEGILDDIEAHDYDVFKRRAHLSTWGKLKRLPTIYWQTRTV